MNCRRSLIRTFLIVICAVLLDHCASDRQVQLPGTLPDGRVRLPNGWLLSPAGKHVSVGELPLNMVATPDERYLLVTNDGTKDQTLSVVDIPSWKVIQSVPLRTSWLGLRMYDRGHRFLLSGGNDNRVDMYSFEQGHATLSDSIVLGAPWPAERISVTGIDVDDPSGTAYVASKDNASLYSINLHTKKVLVRIQLAAAPYTCLISAARPVLYVSLWGGSAVTVVDRASTSSFRTVRT